MTPKTKNKLPESVKATLWSYNLDIIDAQKHKKIIIAQVLNYGDQEAIDWLFKTYGKETVGRVAMQIPVGQWDKKSLFFWSKVLNIKPKTKEEVVYGK